MIGARIGDGSTVLGADDDLVGGTIEDPVVDDKFGGVIAGAVEGEGGVAVSASKSCALLSAGRSRIATANSR